jgi:hypothetical protein
VGRAISIQQHYPLARLAKMMRRPRAKYPGADHGYVVEHAFLTF